MSVDIVQMSFDYASLDSETRAFVQEKAQAIHTRLKRTAEDIIAIGQDLIEVKSRLGHGQFLPWLEVEFDMTRQTAANFMRVAERFGGEKCKIILHLPVTIIYELSSPSMSDIVIEQVTTGQIPATLPAIREAKQQVQAEQHEDVYTERVPLAEIFQPLAPATPLPPSFGLVDGKQFDMPLPDGKPVEIPEEWKLPPPMRGVPSALQSSDSNEWYTPAEYINVARELMGGIDLDPASCAEANKIVGAKQFYTINDSGLTHPWEGRIWLNPPYGFTDGWSNQELWSHRLIDQYDNGNGPTTEAILLVNANTEAKWFQPLYAYLICLTNHRIRFYNATGNASQPTQGNALVYFGPQKRRFIELFRYFGRVVREASPHEY